MASAMPPSRHRDHPAFAPLHRLFSSCAFLFFQKVYTDAESDQEQILGCYASAVLPRTPMQWASIHQCLLASPRQAATPNIRILDSRIGTGRDIGLWSNT